MDSLKGTVIEVLAAFGVVFVIVNAIVACFVFWGWFLG